MTIEIVVFIVFTLSFFVLAFTSNDHHIKIKILESRLNAINGHYYEWPQKGQVSSSDQGVFLQPVGSHDSNPFDPPYEDFNKIQEENELLRKELNEKNYACGDALDKLWQEIILKDNPDYGDWEYAGQAYRHLRDEWFELKVQLKQAQTHIEELEKPLDCTAELIDE